MKTREQKVEHDYNTKVDDSPTKTLAGIRRITEECVEDTSQRKNQTTRLIA